MHTLLELVYKHRQLNGKCDAGAGMSMAEIETFRTIESIFGRHTDRGDSELWECQREFVREDVELVAQMCSKGLIDNVEIINMDPNGMVCRRAPYVDEGTTIELIFRDTELLITYRFKAIVRWLRDDTDDDFELGLQLVGVPLLIRHGAPSQQAEAARAAA